MTAGAVDRSPEFHALTVAVGRLEALENVAARVRASPFASAACPQYLAVLAQADADAAEALSQVGAAERVLADIAA